MKVSPIVLSHSTFSTSPALPQTMLSRSTLPQTMLSPREMLPQTMLSRSTLPQTTLSQSPPPQSLPQTILVLSRAKLPQTMFSRATLPQTMLSPREIVPQTVLSQESPQPLPQTMLSPDSDAVAPHVTSACQAFASGSTTPPASMWF